ncbi:MAG: ABC transporter substrate-binding protein/permease [Deltaproteobacteria bacterium]
MFKVFSPFIRSSALLFSLLLSCSSVSWASSPSIVQKIKERGVLLWGCDAEGGAPMAFPDPKDPSRLIGFEVDIAEAVASRLGVKAKIVQTAWITLIPALERGDFDIAMNGLEITPEREKKILFSRPYYIYTEQLVVSKDNEAIKEISDLKGKKVGTLAGTMAYDMLQNIGGVDIRTYEGVWPYEDVALGRIDAAFLDLPIAAYYGKPDPRLKYAGPPEGEGFYGIAIRPDDRELKKAIDAVIDDLLKTGKLKEIYDRWDIWNKAQEKLFTFSLSQTGETFHAESHDAPLYTFLPTLLTGAYTTVYLSVISMSLAIMLGLAISISRLYGPMPIRFLAAAYVEVYRGTPLLIQLYIIYYGLPNLGIAITPVAAAIMGLAMNYAAYEAEIYRAGIEAIPKGQMEAALSLGMTMGLAVRRVILPQAARIALPPVTNDFIALFKDSSLVSVIAMVELTKTYSILSATTLRFFELGLITALLYFGMSYPLSVMARRLERKLKGKR